MPLLRLILTLILLWLVYLETGLWTTLALGLSVLGIEILAYQLSKLLGTKRKGS